MLGLTMVGCLHTYHDYDFKPRPARSEGYRIYLDARLFDKSTLENGFSRPLDGDIIDPAQTFWSISFSVGLDDSLKGVAHIQVDSIQIVIPETSDTLICNDPFQLTGEIGSWGYWKCGEISFKTLHHKRISLTANTRLVYSDGRPFRQRKFSWAGVLKKTRIHSDY